MTLTQQVECPACKSNITVTTVDGHSSANCPRCEVNLLFTLQIVPKIIVKLEKKEGEG